MVKPTTLSITARAILTAAAERGDHHASPPERLPIAAQRAVVRSMLSAGLIELVPAEDDQPRWHTAEGGERQALRATDAGLAAIGSQITDQGGPASLAAASAPAARDEPAAVEPAQADPPRGPGRLRTTAAAVLAVWDDDADDRPALSSAIDALRAAVATSTARNGQPAEGGTRPPRADTKQATVLALLRRPEGASGPQMADATG